MGESKNAYRVIVGRPQGKRPLGRPRRRWEENIKMDLREMGYDGLPEEDEEEEEEEEEEIAEGQSNDEILKETVSRFYDRNWKTEPRKKSGRHQFKTSQTDHEKRQSPFFVSILVMTDLDNISIALEL
ncbi:hypothetical protein ANN_04833 [Periplaneta americana]|uniref:Uncharacterized protein n=1 Tax=Periplaneta americana TaxID=6978 RepID=A0ABQ8TAB8_PERAM|nr:hypothetical protein ANN_04833 [Periplaneta americana]